MQCFGLAKMEKYKNKIYGVQLKAGYLVQVRGTHSAESTDFRLAPLSHLSQIKMTESGRFRIVP